MENSLTGPLAALGLTGKQIRFFEASFQLGPATIGEIATRARIQRSTAYLLADELLQKGLLTKDLKKYCQKITVISPQQLLQKISGRQRQLRREEIDLQEKLPDLSQVYQISAVPSQIRYFEGKVGLLDIWRDILATRTEILLWTNQATDDLVFGTKRHFQFIEERVRKNIPIRVLAVANPGADELVKTDPHALRQTKILPPDTIFSSETYIYDHKVAIIDFNKDIIGLIIESLPISSFHRSIFNLTWSQIPTQNPSQNDTITTPS